MNRIIIFLMGFILSISIAMPIANATEPAPGDSCTAGETNRFLQVGGPETTGRIDFLRCNGTIWENLMTMQTDGRSLVQIGNDTGGCTTAKTGRLRYNEGSDTWEYCDGSAWGPFERAAEEGGPTEIVKLIASDASDFDRFGRSVAISNDIVVVGSADDDSGTGSAYVFKRQTDGTWSQQAKLVASDGALADNFGWSVAVNGDVIVVGSLNDDDGGSGSGSAYIFARQNDGTWSQQQKLIASDDASNDAFGFSVAIHGDVVVIGARGDDGSRGSAYVFKRQNDGTWSQQAKLIASDRASNDAFGFSASVSGNIAVIGAWFDDSARGSAYVFQRQNDGTWAQRQKLTASDRASFDLFGITLAIGGDVIIIGASGDDSSKGSAYIFARQSDGTWSQQAKLIASDGIAGHTFGQYVAISGDRVIIGAATNNSAYTFARQNDGSWIQQNKLTPSDLGGNFGWSVAVSGDTAIVGAIDNNSSRGAAYIFADLPQ